MSATATRSSRWAAQVTQIATCPTSAAFSRPAQPDGQLGQPPPELFVGDRIGVVVRNHHLRSRGVGYGSSAWSVRVLADQAKVAVPTREPDGVTSLAPRSRPKSTRRALENCPTPSWSSKAPAATVEPRSSRSMQTTRPS